MRNHRIADSRETIVGADQTKSSERVVGSESFLVIQDLRSPSARNKGELS